MDVALIFPGQGAQFVGMGREFYDASSEAKDVFEAADGVIEGLSDVIFNGPEEKLTSTKYCQPAIFTYSMAALAALKISSKYSALNPRFACGLSLGELSALCASGALGFVEALKLVERRSFFMDEACRQKKGKMAAVIGFDQIKLLELCRETQTQVANFNSPDQTVITGEAESINDAMALIKDHGAKRVIELSVAGAFHSELMSSAVPKFEEVLTSVKIKKPNFPVLSNVDALPENNPEYIQRNLSRQITSSVQWVNSIEQIAKEGVTTFLEIGPGTVLKGLIRKINRDLKVYCIQRPDDIEKIDIVS